MILKSFTKMNGASFLALASLFSQVLGFLRDKLLSFIYGASNTLDAYYTSFRIPEFLYLSIGSFVSSAILVPMFAKKIHDDDLKIWFQKLFTTFALFFIFVYGLIVLFLPKIISRLYKHSDILFQESVVLYATILLFSTFFLSMSSIVSSVAQERKDFFSVGLAPIFYNFGTIVGIVLLRPIWGVSGVAVGVVLGSVMHLFIQMPTVVRLGLFNNYRSFILKAFDLKILSSTLNKSFLRSLSLMMSSLTFFLLTYFASLYQEGAITILAIAFTLQTVSHTLVGVSYTTAIFPLLADAFVNKDEKLFDYIMRRGFKKIFLFSFILIGAVFLFGQNAVTILFSGGMFNPTSVYVTSIAFFIFSLSLYAQNAILLLSRASYARGDYFLPFVTNLVSALLTFVIINYALENNLKILGYGFLFIPLAYSIAQYIALLTGVFIHQSKKEITHLYLDLKYCVFVVSTVAFITLGIKYFLSIISYATYEVNSFWGIILFIILVKIYVFCLYLIFGLSEDESIKEHRNYFKEKVYYLLGLIFKRNKGNI